MALATCLESCGRAAALALFAFGISACAEEEPKEDCPARAAFHVVVRARSGPVPTQTAITVDHGGGSEEFRLDVPMKTEILFCKPMYDGDDGGPDAGKIDVESVTCDLWTQGATDVTVEAPGYPLLERELEVETDDGCIQTVNVELLLDVGDAGNKD